MNIILIIYTVNGNLMTSDRNNYSNFEYYLHSLGYYLAPTQSLLQKWLREKHNIFVNINYSFNDKGWVFSIEELNKCLLDENNVLISGIDFVVTFYDSYKNALEKSLFESLKLIK